MRQLIGLLGKNNKNYRDGEKAVSLICKHLFASKERVIKELENIVEAT